MVPDGAFVALLVMVKMRLYASAAVGVKVTLSLHVRPTATGTLQVPIVRVNGPAGNEAAVMMSGAVPVFVTRTVFVVLVLSLLMPKATLAMVAVVEAVTPVPLKVTLVGEPAALWAMLT